MPGPAAPVATVRVAVRDLLAILIADGALTAGDLVLVACSGGPDSVALASQVAFLAPRLGLRAGAVVVDHGLLPGSAATASVAATTCAGLGLDPVLVRTVTMPTQATETAAREVRYTALREAREASSAVGILLGHTLDDQAETVLLALGRGSGTRSVAGMAAVRDHLWRPLLGVRRADTVATCAALGLPYADDPSNAPDGPWRRADGGPVPRAAIRHRVLPALEQALGHDPAPALARTARLARADADLLDRLAEEAWLRCVASDGSLDAATLATEPEALRTRVLRRAALEAGSPASDVLESQVRALEALVTDWHGQGDIDLPGRVVARRVCGRLVLDGSGE